MLAALPPGPSARPEPAIIAARLIPLLPGRVGPEVPSRAAPPSVGMMTRFPTFTYLILYAIFMLLMLSMRWLAVGPQVPAQLNSAASQPAPTVSPQSSPPSTAH